MINKTTFQKITTLFFTTLMITSIFMAFLVPMVAGASTSTMSIIPTTHEVLEGETVTVSIIIDNATDIAGAMARIEFNPSIVSVASVEDGTSFGLIASNYNNIEGFIRMAAARTDVVGVDQIVFANITFQGISPDTSELIFTNAETNCVNGTMSDAAFNNDAIAVNEEPQLIDPVPVPGLTLIGQVASSSLLLAITAFGLMKRKGD